MTSEGIHVFVRVRPPLSDDLNYENAVLVDSGSATVRLNDKKHDVSCTYEKVYSELSSQADVFEDVKPLLDDVLEGVNACVFAYGQTSAGKTHTMMGRNGGQHLLENKSDWGIIPLAAEYLFKELQRRERADQLTFKVKTSFMQLYNERIYDLLTNQQPPMENEEGTRREGGGGLKVREAVPGIKSHKRKHESEGEVYVSGLSEFRVHTASDVMALLAVGIRNRATRATAFNESSSRSHAILQLQFEIEMNNGSADAATCLYRSKLSIVDLAGSEKMYKYSQASQDAAPEPTAQHVKELTNINKSLHALGNVIAALSKRQKRAQKQANESAAGDNAGTVKTSHVPYRDSKLTWILKDSLGGNTRTILIACVAPTMLHAHETLSTLQFADRAKSVMVRIKANVVIDDKSLLVRAQAEIARLKQLLRQALQGQELSQDMRQASLAAEPTPVVMERPPVTALPRPVGGASHTAAEVNKLLTENARLRRENRELHESMLSLVSGYHQSSSSGPSGSHPAAGQQKGSKSKRHGDPKAKKQLKNHDLYQGASAASEPRILPDLFSKPPRYPYDETGNESEANEDSEPSVRIPERFQSRSAGGVTEEREPVVAGRKGGGPSSAPEPVDQSKAVLDLRQKLDRAKTINQHKLLQKELEGALAANGEALTAQDKRLDMISKKKQALMKELATLQEVAGAPSSPVHSTALEDDVSLELEKRLDKVLKNEFMKKEAEEVKGLGFPAGLAFSKSDANTEIQMFSFKLNLWETVTILDYEPTRQLHKCRLGENDNGVVQWIDLRKKSVRALGAS